MKDFYVVKLITDYELLVNMTVEDGVSVGSILEVLDPRTQSVKDPVTGEDLGSLERSKAKIIVESVGEKMSLCRVRGRRPGGPLAAASVISGAPPLEIRGQNAYWPEGVIPGDPVRRTGKRVKDS